MRTFGTFFTTTIPGIFQGAWEAAIRLFTTYFVGPFIRAWNFIKDSVTSLFTGFANGIIGILNRLISSIGRLPIPRVSVGVAYAGIGPLRVPYPTFGVGTRPLSSYIGDGADYPPLRLRRRPRGPRHVNEHDGPGDDPRARAAPTVNYYSLAATDFAREVERLINAPGAQARAVGAP